MRKLISVLVLAAVVSAPTVSAWPTPGFNGETSQQVVGRVFPEARQTNDYVSYFEAIDGLELLEEQHPDHIEIVEIGPTRGWVSAVTGEREPQTIFAVVVTDETSSEDKTNLLFQLSIHGDEKGGREGGLRVIEDLVLAAESGEQVGMATPERVAMLEHQRLIFVFANPDGWVHEEPEYRHNRACYNSVNCDYSSGGSPDQAGEPGVEVGSFVRVNANGTDLNRQAPVAGFIAEDHRSLKEPSTFHTFTWLRSSFEEVHYAADIHGMSEPADAGQEQSEQGVCTPTDTLGEVCTDDGHFVLGMLTAGQFDPVQDVRQTRLAQRANEYINQDPAFDAWRNLPPASYVGGEVAAWGTVWDTIQYTDTGFTSDWYAQEHGLDAVTVGYELAYNNENTDNHYGPAGQELNRMFIAAVRDIVAAFMDQAHQADRPALTSDGHRVAWVPTDVERGPPDAPLTERHAAFAERDRPATINKYFEDLEAASADPSALERVEPGSLSGSLGGVDAVVVPGSAAEPLTDDDIRALKAYVEGGGRLVLTDEAVEVAGELGLELSPASQTAYAGYTNPDRSHRLLEDVRGLARQLVEPIPIGYTPGSIPIWSYDAQAVRDAGGEVAGWSPTEDRASLGVVPVGDGDVVFVGSLLPDPTPDTHVVYRLADYGVTYTGQQIVRNAVGWSLGDGAAAPSKASEPTGGATLPAPGLALVAAAAAAALVLARRRT